MAVLRITPVGTTGFEAACSVTVSSSQSGYSFGFAVPARTISRPRNKNRPRRQGVQAGWADRARSRTSRRRSNHPPPGAAAYGNSRTRRRIGRPLSACPRPCDDRNADMWSRSEAEAARPPKLLL